MRHGEMIGYSVLLGIWILHALQVFVPETGFDALWYHLPVARIIVEHGGLIYDPDMYQSLNPLFSDLFFVVGFAIAGPLGVKVVAYMFACVAIFLTYILSKRLLSGYFPFLALISISLIHTISWQAGSFYVDVAKSVWELAALILLIQAQRLHPRWRIAGAGMLFGASVGTKAFSILLLPLYAFLTFHLRKSYRDVVLMTSIALLVGGMWYIRAYMHTGDPFFAVSQHIIKLDEIGGTSSVFEYVLMRTSSLIVSPLVLITSRDYISPLILFLPTVYFARRRIFDHPVVWRLFLFSAYQWLIWWFVPPLSTRYALSGFITLLIVIVWSLQTLVQQRKISYSLLLSISIIALVCAIIPRLYVAQRSLRFILHTQSKQEYLQQFRDGNIDQHMDAWYKSD